MCRQGQVNYLVMLRLPELATWGWFTMSIPRDFTIPRGSVGSGENTGREKWKRSLPKNQSLGKDSHRGWSRDRAGKKCSGNPLPVLLLANQIRSQKARPCGGFLLPQAPQTIVQGRAAGGVGVQGEWRRGGSSSTQRQGGLHECSLHLLSLQQSQVQGRVKGSHPRVLPSKTGKIVWCWSWNSMKRDLSSVPNLNCWVTGR